MERDDLGLELDDLGALKGIALAVVVSAILYGILYLIWPASAQDGSWVDGLHNQSGNVCCFDGDGRRLEDPEWTAGDPYRVARDGKLVDVPPWALVTMKNRDGIARVWWNPIADDAGNHVRCFLPGALS